MKIFFLSFLFLVVNLSYLTSDGADIERTCEDEAWIMAEIIYDGTGDGFQAGVAFTKTLQECQMKTFRA